MKKISLHIKKAFQTFNQPEMRILPGNIAFFFVLALIPIITMLVVIASYFSISIDTIITFIDNLFPKEASNLIIDVISGRGFDSSVGVFNIIALFVASNGTYAIVNASNTLYQVTKSDSLKDRIKSIILLIILLMLIIFLLIVPIFGEKILALFETTPFIEALRLVYKIIEWPLTVFTVYINLKLIYTIAPSIRVTSESTTYGAIFTTTIWSLATAVFSYYLSHFANYNVLYGNLSSLIILMMWLYIISYVFVMGIAINVTNFESN